MGDITNNEDAENIEASKGLRKKKIVKFTIIGVLIVAVILAIVLPLTLMTRTYYNFEGTGCANANEIEYLK